MGRKQQRATKGEQFKRTYSIYYLPETLETINQIIQEIYSKDYFREVYRKKGKEVRHVHYKAMEKPELMLPKYLYILHYLIRRMLQFKYDYASSGSGISVADLRKRICADTSTTSLMLEILQPTGYGLIVKTQRHSKEKKQACKFKLSEELEKLVKSYESATVVPRFILNRRDHGKMVDRLIQFGEDGKVYNEGEKAAQEEKPSEVKTRTTQKRQDISEPTIQDCTQTVDQRKNPKEVNEAFALKYFQGVHKTRMPSTITRPQDVEQAISKRLNENKAVPPDVKRTLLSFLPVYINSLPTQVQATYSIDDLLEPVYENLKTVYPSKKLLSPSMQFKIIDLLNKKPQWREVREKVEEFLKTKT